MFQIKFGKFISSLRNEKGLTQDELAEKLHVSSGKIISKWENGNALPDFEIIMQLSKELDISLYELSICEKIKSKYISKQDILKIVDKKHIKSITRKKKLKFLTLFIIGIISLLSIIFTVTNFNTTQVYTLQSGTSEFEVLGNYTKTKDYSILSLTEVKYIGDDKNFENIVIINYDYELLYNDKKISHSNQYKTVYETQNITTYNIMPQINILIDSSNHNTHLIQQNSNLNLILKFKYINNKTEYFKIPIKLIEKTKNNKIW